MNVPNFDVVGKHQNSEIMNERTKMRGVASSTKF